MNAGMIYMYAGSTSPSGYLICDGSAVSRTTYSALFAIIGTSYGSGDGETTFNVPNMNGRISVGVSENYALASVGGSESVSLIANDLPSHVHEVPQHGHANTLGFDTPSLSHTVTQPVFKYNNPSSTASRKNANPASRSGYSGTSSSTASRATDATISDHASAACTMGGSIEYSDPYDSGTSGGGVAHNNMQPYIVMNYIICTGV